MPVLSCLLCGKLMKRVSGFLFFACVYNKIFLKMSSVGLLWSSHDENNLKEKHKSFTHFSTFCRIHL